MSYATLSNWTTTDWTDDMENLAREKYVPMVMALGAASVQMVRTGDRSFSVLTTYADEATANAAQERIAAIRAEAADELPMTMSGTSSGAVFASG